MAKKAPRYRVVFELDETGWWTAELPAVDGCVTQGPTISKAAERIREILGEFVEHADRVELVPSVKVPGRIRQKLERGKKGLDKARQAATSLTHDVGLNERDVSQLLGITPSGLRQLLAS